MTRLRRAAPAALLLLASCGGGDADRPAAAAPAVLALERYVDALAAGDVDGAMEQRCPGARVPAAQRARFADDVEALGEIEGVDAEVVADPGLDPVEGRASGHVRYRLRRAGRLGPPLVVVVVGRGDRRLLCGWSTAEAADLHAQLVPLAPGPQATRAPRDLVALDGPAGYEPVGDEPVDVDGAVEAWARRWRTADGSFGGLSLTAARFASPQEALDAAEAARRSETSDAVATFDGTAGVRVLGSAWTWVQDGGVGSVVDSLHLVLGDTHLLARATVTDPAAGHELVRALRSGLR